MTKFASEDLQSQGRVRPPHPKRHFRADTATPALQCLWWPCTGNNYLPGNTLSHYNDSKDHCIPGNENYSLAGLWFAWLTMGQKHVHGWPSYRVTAAAVRVSTRSTRVVPVVPRVATSRRACASVLPTWRWHRLEDRVVRNVTSIAFLSRWFCEMRHGNYGTALLDSSHANFRLWRSICRMSWLDRPTYNIALLAGMWSQEQFTL